MEELVGVPTVWVSVECGKVRGVVAVVIVEIVSSKNTKAAWQREVAWAKRVRLNQSECKKDNQSALLMLKWSDKLELINLWAIWGLQMQMIGTAWVLQWSWKMAFPWDPTAKTVLHMRSIVGLGYKWMALGHASWPMW